jgi:hypothetical protein
MVTAQIMPFPAFSGRAFGVCSVVLNVKLRQGLYIYAPYYSSIDNHCG